ncbi:hypothetical protein EUGRSUZ_C02703 [Eucalyptus grandis]|uniref:Uncharacterized protein n=2 Tax=Eucalyptus grandis TaxID=71139 RepID=A0A059CSX3_EUCGR|nr:hypothetical protein EUGRSUZ_C02703 [Eucalyptus grandis]
MFLVSLHTNENLGRFHLGSIEHCDLDPIFLFILIFFITNLLIKLCSLNTTTIWALLNIHSNNSHLQNR